MNRLRRPRPMRPVRIIILGFLALILTGAFLLMLPISTQSGKGTDFITALFTATSASCVTGLVVQDTATYWSHFGQGIIILLIQIGGLGVITMAISIVLMMGKKIGLSMRNRMQESISAPQISGIVRFTKFILGTTFVIELIGALSMMPVFVRDFGWREGIWNSIFHSISAFCNAGFDLMGVRQKFSSLTTYATNPVINVTIMLLIVIGGLGFLTWRDIAEHRWRIRRYRMQSKVILMMTFLLLAAGAIYFYFVEFKGEPQGRRIWLSLFQSVTPRTAGFNTADYSKMTDTGVMVYIILMLIGGGPASTAGGMKVTTVAVLFASAVAVFRNKKSASLYRRGVPSESVRSASAIIILYLTLFLAGAMFISLHEGIPLLTCMFETSSAIGTVGLTLGITSGLGSASRLVLITLMYVGRVGGLTLILATIAPKGIWEGKYPEEKITVG